MTTIHPTAVVDSSARLGCDVQIGPYSIIGPEVEIGDGTLIESHVVVAGYTVLGERCHIFPFAVLGCEPQDRKYRGEPTRLVLGDDVTVREHVTIHRGTAIGDGTTTVGDRVLLMASCHVAHDCRVGHDVVMTNGATLAGHVTVEPHAVLGGFAAVGQLLKVGESAMLAAGAMVEQDVPPYCTVAGDRARVRAVNVVGLRRRGFDQETIAAIKRAFHALFRSDRPLTEAIEALRSEGTVYPQVERLLAFVEESRRGVCR